MRELFNQVSIELTSEQESQFDMLYKLLIQENEKYNLTAIVEKSEVYTKHFIDSILINKLNFDFKNCSIIDIGTGAGFPALPVKIMNPTVTMTCLDSLNKRIKFIEMVCKQLNLNNVSFIHSRAEDLGRDLKHREKYDFAISRAVAELRLLLEYVIPFVKVNGYFLAYKSLKSKTELDEAKNAFKSLNCKLIEMVEFNLPNQSGVRDIMIIQKTDHTSNKYPRNPGIPKKTPL